MIWRTGYELSLDPLPRSRERQLVDALTAIGTLDLPHLQVAIEYDPETATTATG